MKGRPQQVSRRQPATVGHGIEKAFAPVPSRMKTDREPKVSRAAQRKAKEKTNTTRGQHAHPAFLWVVQVDGGERCREQNCRRPEAHAIRQRELGISAG